jgi:hypothetical protein
MAKEKVNPLTFFREAQEKRNDNFMKDGGTTTTGVINDYSQKFPYGQAGGASYSPGTPSPAYKKGGAKKSGY